MLGGACVSWPRITPCGWVLLPACGGRGALPWLGRCDLRLASQERGGGEALRSDARLVGGEAGRIVRSISYLPCRGSSPEKPGRLQLGVGAKRVKRMNGFMDRQYEEWVGRRLLPLYETRLRRRGTFRYWREFE